MPAISNYHPAVQEILDALGLHGKGVVSFSLNINVDDIVTMSITSIVPDEQMDLVAGVFKKYRITAEEKPIQEVERPTFITKDQVDLFNELIYRR